MIHLGNEDSKKALLQKLSSKDPKELDAALIDFEDFAKRGKTSDLDDLLLDFGKKQKSLLGDIGIIHFYINREGRLNSGKS